MNAEVIRSDVETPQAAAQGAQRAKLRGLVRTGMAQVHAAVTGQVLVRQPLRSLAIMVRDVFFVHLAELEALELLTKEEGQPFRALPVSRIREQYAEQLAELEALCAWPEEEDDLELAIRFETLGTVLLDRIG